MVSLAKVDYVVSADNGTADRHQKVVLCDVLFKYIEIKESHSISASCENKLGVLHPFALFSGLISCHVNPLTFQTLFGLFVIQDVHIAVLNELDARVVDVFLCFSLCYIESALRIFQVYAC